jgi:2-(1,2-epoxy-1,2-dihydrophenyl)acetyl-CoA isomerase
MTEMSSSPVLLRREGAVAHLRFNRPQALNVIDLSLARAFHAACRELASATDLRAVVISGEGRAFMAGGDLAALVSDPLHMPAAVIGEVHPALELLAALRAPVIAAVHGAVAGGGLGVALAADLVIAAEGTKFAMAYPRIGTSADCSTSWNLVRLLGPRKAMEIALLSEPFDAAEALRLGLINRVVPAESLQAEAGQLAARLAAGAPVALANLKRLVREAGDNDLHTHLALEASLFQQCAATADFTEGVGAFLGKREAKFQGR